MAKKNKLSFVDTMMKMKRAGLTNNGSLNTISDADKLLELPDRIKKILQISKRNHINATDMLYFIMYDIENDKVRTQISKYLIKSGCLRVQKSIFFAETKRSVFDKIHKDLKTVQETYDNEDSIFIVPISTDLIQSMKIIGKNDDFDLVIGNNTTYFF